MADPLLVSKAKATLQKGGWDFDEASATWSKKKVPLSIRLATVDSPELVATAQTIASQWRAVGVQVSVQVYALSEFNNTVLRPREYEAILFGEVFGNVQSLKYGRENSVAFAGFAAMRGDAFFDQEALFASLAGFGVPSAPVLYCGPWHEERVLALAEQDSAVAGAPAGHMREGIVIVPREERRNITIGRVAFKHISARYWTGDAE